MDDKNDETTIEDQFAQSWDGIVEFYEHLRNRHEDWGWVNLMIELVNELRRKNYQKYFCVGSSHNRMIVSPTQPAGLREHAFIILSPLGDDNMKVKFYNRATDELIEFLQDNMKLTPEIEALLQKLLEQDIN